MTRHTSSPQPQAVERKEKHPSDDFKRTNSTKLKQKPNEKNGRQ